MGVFCIFPSKSYEIIIIILPCIQFVKCILKPITGDISVVDLLLKMTTFPPALLVVVGVEGTRLSTTLYLGVHAVLLINVQVMWSN